MTRNDVCDFFRQKIAQETGAELNDISADQNFGDLGLDSVNSVFIMEELENLLKISLNPILFWDHPTVDQFVDHILSNQKNYSSKRNE